MDKQSLSLLSFYLMPSTILQHLLDDLLKNQIMFSLDCHNLAAPVIHLLEPKKFIEWAKFYLVIPYSNGSNQQFVLSDNNITEIVIQCPHHSIRVATLRAWQQQIDEAVDIRMGN